MKRLMSKLRSHLLTGIFAFLPLGLTLYFVYVLMVKGNAFILSVTPKPYYNYVTNENFGLLWRALVLMVIMFFFIAVGALTKIYVGRRLWDLSESILKNIPIVNKIYTALKQITSAIFGQQSTFFKRVVLVEYPLKGSFAIAFFTGYARKEISGEERWVNVFLPTTPNPTSGFFLMIPEDKVRYLNMATEDAMKLIISGGAYSSSSSPSAESEKA